METCSILRLLFKGVVGCFLTGLMACWFTLGLVLVLAFKCAVRVVLSALPGYGRMLTPMDMVVWEGYRSSVPLVVVIELDGRVQTDVAELFRCNVVPFYPELSMRIERVLGFWAFRRYSQFHVSDHFCEVSGELGSGEVHAELLNRGFSSDKSPWEVVMFNGGKVLGFRIHHCVADGLSVLKLFVERVGGKVLVKAEKRRVNRGVASTFRWWGRIVSGLGFELLEYLWYSYFGSVEFRAENMGKARKNVVGICELGCFKTVKSVGRSCGVRASSVLVAGILGGLEKFSKHEMGTTLNSLRCGYVLPVSDHPAQLCNHWRTTYSTVEFGKISGLCESLKRFDKVFLDMKHGSPSVMLKYGTLHAGSLVSYIASFLLRNRALGVVITNIAGDDEGFSVGGRDCAAFSLSSGALSGIGICFCVMTYRRRFSVCCVANESVVSGKGVRVLAQYIDAEFRRIFADVATDFHGKGGEEEGGELLGVHLV